MKIALDWIADYLSPVPAAPAAADALMNAGLPVESITDATGAKGPTQILDVEVTSNRTDCFCHVGLARELAALSAGTFTMPKITLTESNAPAAASLTKVTIDDPAGCPYYSARIIRNVKVGPSPEWLQRRLESIGLRPVNNVVDITNFVLMELGQPLHAFDFDALAEKRIIVRRAAPGEKMPAIDGHEYPLEPSMLVIADAKNPVAIAGVMGGKTSEVTEKTTNILLESARFEPLTIRTTSRALGLKSDSSYRFERGIDPTMADLAGRRAAQLILQMAGGELAPIAATAGSPAIKNQQISMRLSRFRQIVGIPVAPERALSILGALGFSPWMDEGDTASASDDCLHTRIPPHRLDVDREIDLIEEIARVNGYQHVPTLDRVAHAVTPESTREKAMRALRTAVVEAGFSEAVTVTFIPEAEAAAFSAALDGTAIRTQHGGWKTDILRPSLLPTLLAARRTNQYAGLPDAHLFETAATFLQKGDAATTPPTERRMLSAVAGDLATLKGLAQLVVERLNPAAGLHVEPADVSFFSAGAAGKIILQHAGSNTAIGHVGLFTPDLQKKYDLRHAVAGMELDLDILLAIFQPLRRATAVPRFPGVKRDLSIVVDEAIRWADIQSAVAGLKLPCLEQITFVTTFRNAQVGAGKKSLTLTLDFRDPARTLKSEEVDAQVQTTIKLLAEKFAATLRA